jgi:NACalpha-BTF3-like transcription factor
MSSPLIDTRPLCIMPNCQNKGLFLPHLDLPVGWDSIVCGVHSHEPANSINNGADKWRREQWNQYILNNKKTITEKCVVRNCIGEALISNSNNDYYAHCGWHCEPGHFKAEDFNIDPERVLQVKTAQAVCELEKLRTMVKQYFTHTGTPIEHLHLGAKLYELACVPDAVQYTPKQPTTGLQNAIPHSTEECSKASAITDADIKLVMNQTGVPFDTAKLVLNMKNGHIVNAIMFLKNAF